MDWKLELLVVPVSDVQRAKDFTFSQLTPTKIFTPSAETDFVSKRVFEAKVAELRAKIKKWPARGVTRSDDRIPALA